jgi:hypothetical protein
MAGAGADNTAGLAFGGYDYSPTLVTGKTESWNGTSWTEVNDLNTARNELAGAGIQNSALAFGGLNPTPAVLGKQNNGMELLDRS